MNLSDDILILGLDPGINATGYAVLKTDVSNTRPALLKAGTIRTKKEWEIYEKLLFIHKTLIEVIKEFVPQEAAIEDVFVSKNARAALKLGHARGVVMLTCTMQGLKVFQYEPSVVKKNITGSGSAQKHQIKYMVGKILGFKGKWSMDTADAIAVALCHFYQRSSYDSLY